MAYLLGNKLLVEREQCLEDLEQTKNETNIAEIHCGNKKRSKKYSVVVRGRALTGPSL